MLRLLVTEDRADGPSADGTARVPTIVPCSYVTQFSVGYAGSSLRFVPLFWVHWVFEFLWVTLSSVLHFEYSESVSPCAPRRVDAVLWGPEVQVRSRRFVCVNAIFIFLSLLCRCLCLIVCYALEKRCMVLYTMKFNRVIWAFHILMHLWPRRAVCHATFLYFVSTHTSMLELSHMNSGVIENKFLLGRVIWVTLGDLFYSVCFFWRKLLYKILSYVNE